MGLLAIVAGQARRVGLIPRLLRALPFLSFICVLSGLAWLGNMPREGQFRNTYFSENALLPHQAITFFRETEWDVVRGLREQLREYNAQGLSEVERNAHVVSLFEEFGLTSALHDWSKGGFEGQNVYAMQRASRGPHNEAIVIVAPWIGSRGGFNEGGIALLLGLSRFFQRWNFWHKNLIFALPSNSEIALREWVEAYHTSLQYTAGSIEGAIVLNYEFEGDFFDHIEIGLEGLNGQLPNLDLVNTAIYSVAAEFSASTVLGGAPSDTFEGRLTTLIRHIWQQASAGVIKGQGSAMFSGWRVDAITLDAIPGNTYYDITTVGRVCESTARSINNLLEHFHQSFFFYLMLGPNFFVSIASFLPAAMLVANSFPVMVLYRLTQMSEQAKPYEWGLAVIVSVSVAVSCSLLSHIAQSPVPLAAGLSVILAGLVVFISRASAMIKQLLHMIALTLLGLQLTALAMINFSLALVLGIVCAPMAWIRPKTSESLESRTVVNALLLSAACPLVVFVALAHYALDIPVSRLLGQLIASYQNLGVSTWPVIMGTWVPLWLVSASCI